MSNKNKEFDLNWMFECPDAILTCSVLQCGDQSYFVFGGHDKTLYLMDHDLTILDSITFDGWCRCSFAIDVTGDGCDEILVGAGDGNFLVVKFVKGLNKLAGIMNYKISKKVLCVTAGDFTRDGNIELILGSEDKTLKIFENIEAKEPKYIFYYDSWVTACALGYLKLPKVDVPIFALVVGTKNGDLQLIQFENNQPDIIWQKSLGFQINVIAIGDVTNDGYHEIVIGTDESKLAILNSEGEALTSIEIEDGRPISIRLEDIDGDNAREILVGCADGSLRIYHNPNLDSSDIKLKWKTSTSSSIKIVSSMRDPEKGLAKILYGGYDRSIRCISDCEWGQKPVLDIPYNIVIPEEQPKEKEKSVEELITLETVPTNIREYILKILIDKRIIEGIANDLVKRGYVKEKVVEEFEKMLTQKSISIEQKEFSIWDLPKEKVDNGVAIPEKGKVRTKKITPVVIEGDVEEKGSALIDALKKESEATTPQTSIKNENLRYIIIDYLERNNVVASKNKMIDDIVILGYDKETVGNLIDIMRDEGKIIYSRSEPKGWMINP
ncbi:MAG: WD40 repeat domain-containing protein [Promethearchaeota archaeon]|nr:MAG: WD40 repeat domain-containing protein [Candidatus Lokiarchaeota archaeon]